MLPFYVGSDFYFEGRWAEKAMNKLLWGLSNTYRRYITLRRFLQIIGITIKFLLRVLFSKIWRRKSPKPGGNPSGGVGVLVRLLIEELGPTFIKFGQILSTRVECPEALKKELEKLQEHVPPFSYEEVEDIIEEEMAAPIEELFISFDKEPLAAASLGQVHKAVLKDGRNRQKRVAVKIQRPDIESIIEVDLVLLDVLACLIDKLFPRLRSSHLPEIVDAFGTSLRREIDYILEGRNADKIAENFKNDDTAYIPKVYWDYTSKRVITEEFVDGIRINDFEAMDRVGLDKYEIALNTTRAYLKMIHEDGFLQADPHPGNLYVLEDNIIVFLDFGMIERIEDKLLDKLGDLILAFDSNDPVRLTKEIMRMHTGGRDEIDVERLELEMGTFIDRHFVDGKMPLGQRGVGHIMDDLTKTVFGYGVRLPRPLVLVFKTYLYVEVLANQLYPGFDVYDMFDPHLKRLGRKRIRNKVDALGLTEPKDLFEDLADAAGEAVDFIKDLPRQATAIMNKVEHGEMEFKVKSSNSNNHLGWAIALAVIIALLVTIVLKI